MFFGIIARVNRVFAVGIVCIAAGLTRAAARPVLDHGVYAVISPAVFGIFGGLHTVAVRLDHFLCHFKIFTERIDKAHPARLGTKVNLRAERRGDAERTVFFRRIFREPADDLGVEARGKADPLRPLADVAAGGFKLRAAAAARTVARVGGNVHRDAVRHAFGKLLQLIVPLCGSLRVFYRNHEDVADVLFVHEFLLLVCKRIRRDICFRVLLAAVCTAERAERHGRHRLVRRIEHETRNRLRRQAGSKVCGALLNGQTPIFIREKLAGLLQVFKIQAVFFDELYTGRRRPRERLAVFGIGADDAVFFRFFHVHYMHLFVWIKTRNFRICFCTKYSVFSIKSKDFYKVCHTSCMHRKARENGVFFSLR